MTGSFEIQMHACASLALSQNKKRNNYTKVVVLEVMHGCDAYQRIIYLLSKTAVVS